MSDDLASEPSVSSDIGFLLEFSDFRAHCYSVIGNTPEHLTIDSGIVICVIDHFSPDLWVHDVSGLLFGKVEMFLEKSGSKVERLVSILWLIDNNRNLAVSAPKKTSVIDVS